MKARALRRRERGAVYVEFIIAFLPMLIFFECLVQLGGLYQAKIIAHHAASTAVRAAVVVLHDDPKHYDGVALGSYSGARKDAIEKAASIPLRAQRNIVDFELKLDKSQYGRNDLVKVTLNVDYRCAVPIARRIVCAPFSMQKQLTAEAALQNQGADYEYEP